MPGSNTIQTTTSTGRESEKNSTSTPQIPQNQSTSKSGHGSILNRFKIQFENVVHLKPNNSSKTETNTSETTTATTTPTTQVSDTVDLTEENQKTVTKKDGLALLKQCLKEQEKIKKEESEQQIKQVEINDDKDISSGEAVGESKSPSEIASKLNDLYFKHLEEETKEQSKSMLAA